MPRLEQLACSPGAVAVAPETGAGDAMGRPAGLLGLLPPEADEGRLTGGLKRPLAVKGPFCKGAWDAFCPLADEAAAPCGFPAACRFPAGAWKAFQPLAGPSATTGPSVSPAAEKPLEAG